MRRYIIIFSLLLSTGLIACHRPDGAKIEIRQTPKVVEDSAKQIIERANQSIRDSGKKATTPAKHK